MPKCGDCLHWELCSSIFSASEDSCEFYKDRTRFLELPIIDDYDEAKLLDIAIDYCYNIAMSSDPNICAEYKAGHMRICGWLGDLRRRIEAEQSLRGCENNAE